MSTPGKATLGGSSGIVTHYTRYAIGEVLAIATGFVSFPILSRKLSNYEFGVIGYLDAILLLVVAILKFGLGDALLRFYPHKQGEPAFHTFVASLVLVPLAASFAIWVLLMGALAVALSSGWIGQGMAVLLAFAGVPCSILASYVQWLMMAQERSGINVLLGTTSRWLQTLLVIALVVFLAPTASSVYLGRFLAAVAVMGWMLWWLCRQTHMRFADVDLSLTRKALAYSLPLAMNEISLILFSVADRWILNAMLGDLASVGIYVIGSSLSLYVSALVGTTLAKSYTPVLNRLYIEEGDHAVMAFKRRIFVPMIYVVVLLVAGLLLTGHDFFVVVAGPDKLASAPIFVMLSVTFAVSTLFTMAGYGAILAKRTGLLLCASLIAVAVKVASNFLLIPVAGVMGTVYATMLAQVTLAVAIYMTCPPALRCLPPIRVVLHALLLAGVAMGAAWTTLRAMPLQPPVVRLAVGGSLVLAVYLLPLWLMFPQLRISTLQMLRRWR